MKTKIFAVRMGHSLGEYFFVVEAKDEESAKRVAKEQLEKIEDLYTKLAVHVTEVSRLGIERVVAYGGYSE